MTQDIKRLLEQLNQARQEASTIGASKNELRERLMADPALKMLTQRKQIADAEVERIEAALREAALKQFQADGVTKCTGYEIKHIARFDVSDTNRARDWCITNMLVALTVDWSMFKKAAKAGAIPAELFDETKEPTVYIKSDLENALHGETAPSA